MKKCSTCNNDLPPQALFCPHCGTHIGGVPQSITLLATTVAQQLLVYYEGRVFTCDAPPLPEQCTEQQAQNCLQFFRSHLKPLSNQLVSPQVFMDTYAGQMDNTYKLILYNEDASQFVAAMNLAAHYKAECAGKRISRLSHYAAFGAYLCHYQQRDAIVRFQLGEDVCDAEIGGKVFEVLWSGQDAPQVVRMQAREKTDDYEYVPDSLHTIDKTRVLFYLATAFFLYHAVIGQQLSDDPVLLDNFPFSIDLLSYQKDSVRQAYNMILSHTVVPTSHRETIELYDDLAVCIGQTFTFPLQAIQRLGGASEFLECKVDLGLNAIPCVKLTDKKSQNSTVITLTNLL